MGYHVPSRRPTITPSYPAQASQLSSRRNESQQAHPCCLQDGERYTGWLCSRDTGKSNNCASPYLSVWGSFRERWPRRTSVDRSFPHYSSIRHGYYRFVSMSLPFADVLMFGSRRPVLRQRHNLGPTARASLVGGSLVLLCTLSPLPLLNRFTDSSILWFSQALPTRRSERDRQTRSRTLVGPSRWAFRLHSLVLGSSN